MTKRSILFTISMVVTAVLMLWIGRDDVLFEQLIVNWRLSLWMTILFAASVVSAYLAIMYLNRGAIVSAIATSIGATVMVQNVFVGIFLWKTLLLLGALVVIGTCGVTLVYDRQTSKSKSSVSEFDSAHVPQMG